MKKIALSLLTLLVLGFISLIYIHETDSFTQKYLNERDPVVKLQLLEQIMERGENEKWSWSDNAAKIAFQVGDHEKAEKYAQASLAMSKDFENNWNYGNAIHNSNVILGRISLAQGNIEEAKAYLVRASKSHGSPQLDTFGPNFKLANELLKKGESDVVVQYLRSVSKFWEMDNGCIDRWLSEIDDGETPSLCKCSC
ncbi:hypothetical protein R50072_01320 [Simiduia litorea]|uniref:tetratricopeptide repeat protein n=1 Tax=Simiduia litorea TaxID=1435348 RepID=UPI0036F3EB65